jgi:hypothetical protein
MKDDTMTARTLARALFLGARADTNDNGAERLLRSLAGACAELESCAPLARDGAVGAPTRAFCAELCAALVELRDSVGARVGAMRPYDAWRPAGA